MYKLLELHAAMGAQEFSLWLACNIICAILSTWVNLYLFIGLFNLKFDKKKILIFILLDSICKMTYSTFVPPPYYRLPDLFTSVFFAILILKVDFCQYLVGEVINNIFIVALEGTIVKFYYVLFKNISSYTEGMYSFKFKACVVATVIIIKLIAMFCIKKFNFRIPIKRNLNKKIRREITIMCSVGVVLVFFNFFSMDSYISDFAYTVLLTDVFALSLYCYLGIKYILKVAKLVEQDKTIESLETYNKTLTIMYDNLRCFKHDFTNFVQALDGYAKLDDMNGIKSLSASILKDCKCANKLAMLNPANVNNPGVYSIIANKYYLAKEHNVEMNIDIKCDMRDVKEVYDLCSLLGILLDNAIEAADKCKDRMINVKFNMAQNEQCKYKYIIIENTYNHNDITINKMFEKGFTTKTDSNNEHGLGLWNAQRLVHHSDGIELITKKEDLFIQRLNIYDVKV